MENKRENYRNLEKTMNKTMTTFLLLFLCLFNSNLVFLAAAAAPPPWPSGCAGELVLLSQCLSYVSAPPNNLTATVSPQCCEVFSSGFESGFGNCFCYLLRQPNIFGFPLNQTRILSLPLLCRKRRGNLTSRGYDPLDSLCHAG